MVMQRVYLRISDDSSGRVAGMVQEYRDRLVTELLKDLAQMGKRLSRDRERAQDRVSKTGRSVMQRRKTGLMRTLVQVAVEYSRMKRQDREHREYLQGLQRKTHGQ